MKKLSIIFKILLLVALISAFSVVSVFAADGLTGEEFPLVSEDSGYKIVVPGFIEIRTVDVDGDELTVVVMEVPEKESDGKYSIFEIVTTQEDVSSLESYPRIYNEGEVGDFRGIFENGRVVYRPNFTLEEDLKDLDRDLVFSFDFLVYDEESSGVFSVAGLFFMFDDKEQAPAQEDSSVAAAKPTSAKVMVDGKAVAFEAYNIDGSNYFKLRDLAMALNGTKKQFQVSWDDAKSAINIVTGTAYTPVGKELTVSENPTDKEAKPTNSRIYINGKEVQLTAYSIGGNNYFKLRDIGKAADFSVVWNDTLSRIEIGTSSGYVD